MLQELARSLLCWDPYTFGGGLSERRACLLANRGFVVLTVALYGHDHLPKRISQVHLDYFKEATLLKKTTQGELFQSLILERGSITQYRLYLTDSFHTAAILD